MTDADELVFLEVAARFKGMAGLAAMQRNYGIAPVNLAFEIETGIASRPHDQEQVYCFDGVLPKKKGIIDRLLEPEVDSEFDLTWKVKPGERIDQTNSLLANAGTFLMWNKDYEVLYRDFKRLAGYEPILYAASIRAPIRTRARSPGCVPRGRARQPSSGCGFRRRLGHSLRSFGTGLRRGFTTGFGAAFHGGLLDGLRLGTGLLSGFRRTFARGRLDHRLGAGLLGGFRRRLADGFRRGFGFGRHHGFGFRGLGHLRPIRDILCYHVQSPGPYRHISARQKHLAVTRDDSDG